MNEDIEFLKKFQEELKTQEYDSQASPRFWTIMDYRIVPANPDYDNAFINYIYNDGDFVEFKNINDLKEFLLDSFEERIDEIEEFPCLHNPELNFEELWENVEEYLNDEEFFQTIDVKEEPFVRPNTMFLTKEDAKLHLKLNHYHYSSKAHTYAMTAWRSPKVERLLKILENFDWDEVAEIKGENE
jgi:hypothetical protein